MKNKYYTCAFIILLFIGPHAIFSQDNKKPWIFGLELNAIDFYPVGEDEPQGVYFDEFFNLTDHWNIGIPKFTAYKYLSERFSISASASFNQIKKLNQLGASSGDDPDNLTYFGLDGMFNYYFSTSKFKPFIAIGGGYTWVEEGHFDSSKIAGSNLIGAGTLNGAVGAKYWFDESFGINFQTTYKHSFENYLSKHWQHSIGVVFNLKIKEEEEKEEQDNDRDGDGVLDEFDNCPDTPGLEALAGCPDTDGDGVADKDDQCPEIFGLKKYNGCPDTDGDGYADNIDDCPEVKGTLQGCPEDETVYCFEDLDDISAYFASLKRDGKIEVVGLKFKVQVGAYQNPPSLSYFDFLQNVGELEEIKEDELTKYRLGDFRTLEETEAIRINVFDKGIHDAFVIAFFNGKRIPMRLAIETLCDNQ